MWSRINSVILKKKHRLRRFQIDQAPKMIIELSPCLTSPSTLELASDHQSSKDGTVGCGERLCNPTLRSNKNQNPWTNTQPTSKWLIIFRLLVTEGAMGWVWQTSLFNSISCPTFVLSHQPHIKLTFAQCPWSPNSVMVLIHQILFWNQLSPKVSLKF